MGQGLGLRCQVRSPALVLALEVVYDSPRPWISAGQSVGESWVLGNPGLGSGCCRRTPREEVTAAQTARPSPCCVQIC